MPDAVAAGGADAQLVSAMAAGDEGALAALYDRYGAMLFALALRIVGDAPDAEEVVMDALSQAWRGARDYAPDRGSVPAWLVVLVRSRALDRRRAAERRGRALARAVAADPGASPAMSAPPPSAGAAAEASEQRARVLAALGDLPQAQRVCLELAYFEGLSQSEIAARLAEPLGTIKTRTRQALLRLRERLTPRPPERA